MANIFLKKLVKQVSLASTVFIVTSSSAFARGLPFESAMEKLKDAITGPFLLGLCIVLLVASCIAAIFMEMNDGWKKLVNIVFWLSLAFGASIFITTMFG